jgi:hypothetical protein
MTRTLVGTPDPEPQPTQDWTMGIYTTGTSSAYIAWTWNGWSWRATA